MREELRQTHAWVTRILKLSSGEDFEKGMKVRWKSAYNSEFWGGYVQPGDTGTILDVRRIGGQTSVKVRWDKVIKSKSGKDMQQVTHVNALDLDPAGS